MQTPASIIQKKRDGEALSNEEIRGFIGGMATGEVADYQATAFLMAVYFQGMTLNETVALTQAMLESGERYDLSAIPGRKADKHSTGGIGDKVSLILAPLAAACGLKVPMMAGRGLGHTGGTLDKLESISGFDVTIPRAHFEQILRTNGCAIIGQTETIAPADKKLYALRDVTATVECIPLIVASILSKKLAEGTDSLVLDVKVGSGAFMKSRDQAKKLAKTIIAVGKKLGIDVRAVLTNMDQPLGYSAGNSLEVIESIEILRGERYPVANGNGEYNSCDVKELTIQLCAHMLDLSGAVKNLAEGRKMAHARLADGSAWKKFEEMVRQQGGDLSQIRAPLTGLPLGKRQVVWKAKKRGYITKIDSQAIGKILIDLGGGRRKASDAIDFGVGFVFHKKLGARVTAGEALVTVTLPDRGSPYEVSASALGDLEKQFIGAIQIASTRKAVPKLITEVIG